MQRLWPMKMDFDWGKHPSALDDQISITIRRPMAPTRTKSSFCTRYPPNTTLITPLPHRTLVLAIDVGRSQGGRNRNASLSFTTCQYEGCPKAPVNAARRFCRTHGEGRRCKTSGCHKVRTFFVQVAATHARPSPFNSH